MTESRRPRLNAAPYRGRLAPSPTGYLHLGHARTFWIAWRRAQAAYGTLVFRNEDLDCSRARPEFAAAMIDDLRWLGLNWQEGPNCGGPFAPYNQSERYDSYLRTLQCLFDAGWIYPCTCSRQDVLRALQAPHQGEEEPVYPGTCRPRAAEARLSSQPLWNEFHETAAQRLPGNRRRFNWRFRVPDGEAVAFVDGHYGLQRFVAGKDFGDFVVWRHDNVPAYQLAVVADDSAMRITEVVRGVDLLASTARQLLLYKALALEAPTFYHCPLMTDEKGVRLAKRNDALSLRTLRQQGIDPGELLTKWASEDVSCSGRSSAAEF